MSLLGLVRRIEEEFDRFEDDGLTIFLVALVSLSFGLMPFITLEGPMRLVVSVAYTALFVVGAFLGTLGHRWRAFAIVLGFVSVVTSWWSEIAPGATVETANAVLSLVFMMLVCVAILRQVFRPGPVNAHRMRGAVAAYLLVGYIFAMAFALVAWSNPESFHGMAVDTRDHLFRDAVYLSFVTLTTLGYGDITPASEIARTIVIVEAIVGQLFLAILIARLISLSVSETQLPERRPRP